MRNGVLAYFLSQVAYFIPRFSIPVFLQKEESGGVTLLLGHIVEAIFVEL